ncbi:hypothetical protein WA158_007606 [Blastocystis sp. Blastoise]
MSGIILRYFAQRGRADSICLALELAGLKYKDIRFSHQQWPEIKAHGRIDGSIPFGQVPLLEIDGLNLVQSGAILRFIARKCDLYGSNIYENALVDMVIEGFQDVFNKLTLTCQEPNTEEALENYEKQYLHNILNEMNELKPKYGDKWFVGSTPTIADCYSKLSCIKPQQLIQIERYSNFSTYGENVTIYEGSRYSGRQLLVIEGKNEIVKTQTFDLCLDPIVHGVYAESLKYYGWEGGSLLIIHIGDNLLLRKHLDFRYEEDWLFYPSLLLNDDTYWKYKSDETVPSNWFSPFYVPYLWNWYNTGSLIDGRLFLFDIGITTIDGFVLYINGKEVTRYYIPEGPIYFNTTSISPNITPHDYHITGNINYYNDTSTELVFAIEVHTSSLSSTHSLIDPFKVVLLMIPESYSIRTFNINANYIVNTELDTSSNSLDNLFNNDINSNWMCVNCHTASIYIQYQQERREWINKIKLVGSPTNIDLSPSCIEIYASNNDGSTWITLLLVKNIEYTKLLQSHIYTLPSNIKAYNQYRIDILSTFNSTADINISELDFYATSEVEIIPSFQYYFSTYKAFVNITMKMMSPLSSGYSNFHYIVDTPLPEGISFSTYSGEFQGIPTGIYEGNIKVYAYNSLTKQEEFCILFLSVDICDSKQFFQLRFVKHSGSFESSHEIYQLRNSNNQLLFSGESIDSKVVYNDLCISRDTYTVILLNDKSNYWSTSSYLDISLVYPTGIFIIFRGTINAGYRSSSHLNLQHGIPFFSNETLYFSTHQKELHIYNNNTSTHPLSSSSLLSSPPSNWYTSTYIEDSHWIYYNNLGDYPLTDEYQHYYRNTFYLSSITDYHGIGIGVVAPSILDIYINDQLIHRTIYNTVYTTSYTNKYDTSSFRSIDPSLTIMNNTYSIMHSYALTFPISFLHIGNNTIAFYIQYPNHTVDSRNWEMNVQDNHGNDVSVVTNFNYFDGYSYTSSTPFLPYVLTFTYKSAYRYEYVNKICLINNDNNDDSTVTNITLYGCNSSLHLSSMSNTDDCQLLYNNPSIIWSSQRQRLCALTKRHTESYSKYMLSINNVRGGLSSSTLSLNEVEFMSETIISPSVTPLQYISQTIKGYIYIPFPSFFPITPYYNYSIIKGTLPEGLSLDKNDGTISGTPQQRISYQFITIQAYTYNNEESTTTITIIIDSCLAPKLLLSLQMNNKENFRDSIKEFTLYDPSTLENIGHQSIFLEYKESLYYYCVSEGVYTLILSETNNEGWNGASISVYQNINTLINTYTLYIHESPLSIFLHLYSSDFPSLPTYIFLNNAITTSVPSKWTLFTSSSYPPSWSIGTPLSFPDPVGITQYYITSYIPHDITLFIGLSATISVIGGCVMYLNGKEFFRYNLPNNITITNTTLATHEYPTPFQTGGSVSFLNYPNSLSDNIFIVALELHRGITPYTNKYFDVTLSLLHDGSSNMNHGYPYSPFQSDSSYPITNVFDGNYRTKWEYDGLCEGVWIQYKYNESRREYINYYEIRMTQNCNNHHPSGWDLEASNDGIHWDLLHSIKNQLFTTFYERRLYGFYPTKSYNTYRFTFTQCNNILFSQSDIDYCVATPRIHISSILLLMKNTTSFCEVRSESGVLSLIPDGEIYTTVCGPHYKGTKTQECINEHFYDIDISHCKVNGLTSFSYPSKAYIYHKEIKDIALYPQVDSLYLYFEALSPLPEGLAIDNKTGAIYGDPVNTSPLTTYSIMAKDGTTYLETTISIVITDENYTYICPMDEEWPETIQGEQVSLPCLNGFQGERTRYCIESSRPYWSSITSNCTNNTNISVFTYLYDSYILPIKAEISICPDISGNISSFVIIPPLDIVECTFNSTSGCIYGTPLYSFPLTSYTITSTTSNDSQSVTLSLTVTDIYCKEDNDWPFTAANTTRILVCSNQLMEGHRYRFCTNSSEWENEYSTCHFPQPHVTYPQSTNLFYVNHTYVNIYPTIQGYVTSFSIYPNLPKGIYFNSLNGSITGIAEEYISATPFLITIQNPSSYSIYSIVFTFIQNSCRSIDIWPSIESGESAVKDCLDPSQEGGRIRYCLETEPPTWSPIYNNCTYKAPIVYYPSSSFVFYYGEYLSITPIRMNFITYWNISPSIPAGLSFDSLTGILHGTPSNASHLTEYTITAGNPNKSTNITIYITVITLYCDKDEKWLATPINQIAFLPCLNDIYNIQFRECIHVIEGENDTKVNIFKPPLYNEHFSTSSHSFERDDNIEIKEYGQWKQENTNMCRSLDEIGYPPENYVYLYVPIELMNYPDYAFGSMYIYEFMLIMGRAVDLNHPQSIPIHITKIEHTLSTYVPCLKVTVQFVLTNNNYTIVSNNIITYIQQNLRAELYIINSTAFNNVIVHIPNDNIVMLLSHTFPYLTVILTIVGILFFIFLFMYISRVLRVYMKESKKIKKVQHTAIIRSEKKYYSLQ